MLGRDHDLSELTADLMCSCDHLGVIKEINAAGAVMLGILPTQKYRETLVGRAFSDFLSAEGKDAIRTSLKNFATFGIENCRVNTQIARLDGTFLDIEMLASCSVDEGLLIVARDVSAQNNALALAEAATETMRIVMESMPDGVLVMSENGTILMANSAASTMFGFSSSTFLIALNSQTLFQGVGSGDNARPVVINRARVRRMGNPLLELEAVRRNGERFPVEISLNEMSYHSDNGEVNLIAIVRDVSLRHEAEEKLRVLATQDPLTGLANRLMFQEELLKGMRRVDEEGDCLAVFYVDFDYFQNTNDAFGHNIGDAVIRQAGARLMSVAERVGHDFCVARAGGDEFHILIYGLENGEPVQAIAGEIVEVLGEPFDVNGLGIYLSASVGVGLYPDHAAASDDLLRIVDIATNEVKRGGRGSFCIFEKSMSDRVHRRVEIGNKLREALVRDEFHLVYQPKVCLTNGRIVGAEALLRWESDELGTVGPDEFVTIAEETGLIVPIGDWVLNKACDQAALWRTQGNHDIHVAVNLSVMQFRRGNIVERVKESLDRSGLPPSSLDIELTESLLVEQHEETAAALHALKETGVTVAMDDFGTGYSSLSYLTRLPLDTLKIFKAAYV